MTSIGKSQSALFFLLSTILVAAGQLTWKRLDNPAAGLKPAGRRDHAIGYDVPRNRIILFGGRNGEIVYGDTWIFDLSNNTWMEVNTSSKAPQKRFSMVYGISRGSFYVSTGQEAANLYDDIWMFNLTSHTWRQLPATGKKPGTIYGAAGGFYSDSSTHFFVTLGFSKSVRYANTLVFDITTNHWTEVFPDRSNYIYGHPNSRCLHSGTMIAEDRLVMYGGCASGGQTGGACPGFDSWIFSSSKESWTRLPECASPRLYSSMALLPEVRGQQRVVLYGGSESNSEVLQVDKADPDQVAILNVNSEEWVLKRANGTSIPAKRTGAAMVAHPQGALMIGGSAMNDVWMLEGDTTAADNAPKHSQSCKKPFAGTLNLIMLHGIFMVIGWGILLQAGAFIARYFRNKDPLWFHLHRIFQVVGLLFAIAGLICASLSVRFDHFKFAHGGLGLFVMLLGIQQPFNALIRPHKRPNEPTALKRKIWEYFHMNSGRLALILSVVTISLGLLQGEAREGHLIAWHSYVALFVIAYLVMEVNLVYKRIKVKSENIEMR